MLREAEPARRARLRAELLDHLAEAVTLYQARGLDAEDALMAALADLSSPAEIARTLRQNLLQPPAARLRAARRRWGLPLLLALLSVLAL